MRIRNGWRKARPQAIAAIAVGLVVLAFATTTARAESEADEFIRRMEELTRADTNVATYRMKVLRADEADSREFRIQSWDNRLDERSFILILEPRRDENTTFLRVDGNLWMYIPRLERDIKLPPAMMLNSWMGSDFTNDDLVNESSVVEDYTNTITVREPGPEGMELVTINSVPHPDAPVVWGRVEAQVRSDGIPVWQKFYDEDGALVRTMIFEDVRELGGRTLPTRTVMLPADEKGNSTVLIIEDISFDQPIGDSVFTRANLSRRR